MTLKSQSFEETCGVDLDKMSSKADVPRYGSFEVDFTSDAELI